MICVKCGKRGAEKSALTVGEQEISAYSCKRCNITWFYPPTLPPDDLMTQADAARHVGRTLKVINDAVRRKSLTAWLVKGNKFHGRNQVSRAEVERLFNKADKKDRENVPSKD